MKHSVNIQLTYDSISLKHRWIVTGPPNSPNQYNLMPTIAIIMSTAIKHPVPNRVKLSFVIFDIWALWCLAWAPECLDVKNYKWLLNPVWHRMPYSCTHIVGVKGIIGSLKTRARLKKPASCTKGSQFWCSASKLTFCTTVYWLKTVKTDDRTKFCISSIFKTLLYCNICTEGQYIFNKN